MRRRALIAASFLLVLGFGTSGAQGLVAASPGLSGQPWIPFEGTAHTEYRASIPSVVRTGAATVYRASTTGRPRDIPQANYVWTFGDGTAATGANVRHSFARAGSYSVNLRITDAGGCNNRTLGHTVRVLGSSGSSDQPSGSALRVRPQLMPQSRQAVLGHGMALLVTSNQAADGFTTLCISSAAARQAHIASGGARSELVAIGQGTVSGIRHGRVMLHILMAKATAARLAHLPDLTLTLRMRLFAGSGLQTVLSVIGRY
jgi:PKD domain